MECQQGNFEDCFKQREMPGILLYIIYNCRSVLLCIIALQDTSVSGDW